MSQAPRILVVDDDPLFVQSVDLLLGAEYRLDLATSIDQALVFLEDSLYDIVLLDFNFEGDTRDGLHVFRALCAKDLQADVIVISGESNPKRLIEILNAGVAKFLSKPSSADEIRSAVNEIAERRRFRHKTINQARGTKDNPIDQLIGNSESMLRLKEQIARAVESKARDILLVGETGTGKEVVAKIITQMVDPSARMFPINCAALSDSLVEAELFGHERGAYTGAIQARASAFEVVQGGVVFLDEIGDMPIHHQVKLLRVLQERQVRRLGSNKEINVSFRSISATHVNLKSAIAKKVFREDLFYRISKAVIEIPALRERKGDIPILVESIIARRSPEKKITVTEDALKLLKSFDWPGNVRQLESVIENAIFLAKGGTIREREICHVIPELAGPRIGRPKSFLGSDGEEFVAQERRRFVRAIDEAGGDRDKAAKALGLSRATFYRRTKDLGLSVPKHSEARIRTLRSRVLERDLQ
jgi:DNA-binding NtrC family response regulator